MKELTQKAEAAQRELEAAVTKLNSTVKDGFGLVDFVYAVQKVTEVQVDLAKAVDKINKDGGPGLARTLGDALNR